MAKAPVPGRVKTRLTPTLSPDQAAEVHTAMMQCVLDRLSEYFPAASPAGRVLALDGDLERVPRVAGRPAVTIPPGWRAFEQGPGDLGERLIRVWERLGRGPVAFFGVDRPDVPADALQQLARDSAQPTLKIGPAYDGGYWTIAMNVYRPQVFTGIDWGTTRVYDQTLSVAENADLSLHALPTWWDVDQPADVVALRHRLDHTREPPLQRLAQRLDACCPNVRGNNL